MSRLYLGLIAVMSFLAFQANWDCQTTSNSPTKAIKSLSAQPNPDPVQYGSPGLVYGCAFQPAYTSMFTWHVTYADNTMSDLPIYWPKGGSPGGISNLGIYFAPPAASNVVTQGTNAVNAWNTALTRDIFSGGTATIQLQITNDYTAPVRVYTDNGANLSPEAGIPGAEVFGTIPSPYTTLNNAEILLMSYPQDLTLYYVALHEFGHALGLMHNKYQTSVMFPTDGGVLSIGQTPLSADTHNLELVYDPRYAPPGGHCGACPRSPSDSIAAGIKRIRSRYPRLVDNDEDLRKGKPMYVHLDDHSGSQFISTESLYISSTLVTQVDVIGDARYFYNGPVRTTLKIARIKNLLRHLKSPDAGRVVGELIYIADLERADGSSFIDDPALSPGVRPIVFLRRTHRFDRFIGPLAPVYEFTEPFVSKMVVRPNHTVEVAGPITSRVAHEMNGRPISQLFSTLRSRYGIAMVNEDSLLNAMLAKRGLRANQQAPYLQAMTSEPRRVLEWSKNQDIMEVTRERFHVARPY